MVQHQLLLDAFADARRTWDDMVGLQPDVMTGSGNFGTLDLNELERRVGAHRLAIAALTEAIEAEPQLLLASARATEGTE